MASNIISSFDEFQKRFDFPKNDERINALKKYFERGGVISALPSKKPWPRLVYPSPLRIQTQIEELKNRKKLFLKKEADWRKKLNEAKNYHMKHHILKLSEPIYWKHVTKMLTDKEYKADAEAVGLPAHLAADPRYKPMVKMFLEDAEYRKNLVETVQKSFVYKNKKVGNYANILQDFRIDVSEAQLKDIEAKIKDLDEQIKSLEIIKAWASSE
jgi:hypothetical protein